MLEFLARILNQVQDDILVLPVMPDKSARPKLIERRRDPASSAKVPELGHMAIALVGMMN